MKQGVIVICRLIQLIKESKNEQKSIASKNQWPLTNHQKAVNDAAPAICFENPVLL